MAVKTSAHTFVLCSRVSDDPNGTYSVHGIAAGALLTPELPAQTNPGAFIRFEYQGSGKVRVHIDVIGPRGKMGTPVDDVHELPPGGSPKIIIVRPIPVPIEAAGNYRFELYVDAQRVAHFTLPVLHSNPPTADAN